MKNEPKSVGHNVILKCIEIELRRKHNNKTVTLSGLYQHVNTVRISMGLQPSINVFMYTASVLKSAVVQGLVDNVGHGLYALPSNDD